ncbi:hypothetical protein AWU65_02010 [Paenibacillus glucanolyticus]|uniref:ADP-ribosylglycohydrolase n=2 Tax=Paenibacillus TaxID=44249 RepID=A0A163MDD4_9BACL|nr:hypothetical protein AWU65_02010 [Paenibacillus glucanolyticus]OMF64778.1 hypothetical protein BK142_31645 [Paenibacillus glucanolyticus]
MGSCVGDALGVPVEFKGRKELRARPIRGLTGYGTWNQPPGTWSDDSSLFLCTLESLLEGYSLQSISDRFLKWYKEGYWTANGVVFDIGTTTRLALDRLSYITPTDSGLHDEDSNSNGSLMRILPLAFISYNKDIQERVELVEEVSSITHAHRRSVLACIILIEIASNLLKGHDRISSYYLMQETMRTHFGHEFQITYFPSVYYDIQDRPEDAVLSTGYVVDTLEAAIWCFLKHDSYKDVVLAAVNLGGDTDTIGTIAGGLAGMAFGYNDIPRKWVLKIARKDDIEDLAKQVCEYIATRDTKDL